MSDGCEQTIRGHVPGLVSGRGSQMHATSARQSCGHVEAPRGRQGPTPWDLFCVTPQADVLFQRWAKRSHAIAALSVCLTPSISRPAVSSRLFSDRQLTVASPGPDQLHQLCNNWPNHWDALHVARNRDQKVPEQDHDAVAFDEEPNKCPPEQDQGYPYHECDGASYLLPPSEEEKRLLGPNDQG